MFASPLDHLRAELSRLDLLIHREILRLRAEYQLSRDEFRGLYISDDQVDSLVARSAEQSGLPDCAALTRRAAELRKNIRSSLPEHFPWARLVREFGLSEIEEDVLLIALAPEIELKYETLYAYLHNDVTRKAADCDLASRLLAASSGERLPAERLNVRRALEPDGKLFREALLLLLPDPRPRLLGREFAMAPPVARYLLELDSVPSPPAAAWQDVLIEPAFKEALRHLDVAGPPVALECDDEALARQIAEAACGAWRISLRKVELSPGSIRPALDALRLSQRLRRQGVLLTGAASLWPSDGVLVLQDPNLTVLSDIRGPVFLHVLPDTAWMRALAHVRILGFRIRGPDYPARRQLWIDTLARYGSKDEKLAADLAARFVLPASRVAAAARMAGDRRDVERRGAPVSRDMLFDAARAQSEQSMGKLAVKPELVDTWEDLVLPQATQTQLREVATAARWRHLVYETWNMGRARSTGLGVKVLFAGAAGTGKTMSARVLARDLGLDLYQIDLASVVSKYIGETEKNLDRIFNAARGSNAVLFFDEADALFGKRSEVKDAHDRYANIEVAYLLQKMDAYDGIAILASNLPKNIDEAFSRRLHYMVEFPLPDEALRIRLWRQMFPPQVPLGGDVDLEFLARQFRLSGGDIRNVALAAAFLAAGNGQIITMELLSGAMARYLVKQGRVPSASDFKHYYPLVSQGVWRAAEIEN
jgi:hypothetical protein